MTLSCPFTPSTRGERPRCHVLARFRAALATFDVLCLVPGAADSRPASAVGIASF